MSEITETVQAEHDVYRADLAHYWARLMWYRDELWRITIPVWAAYGAFIAACVGYVWSKDKVTGPVALMLIFVIALFSWVILRVYWIYAHCIYTAIKYLNEEIREREQHIYNVIMGKKQWTANYRCFRVYPELNMLFSIVGVAMMVASMFIVAASVEFDFEKRPLVQAAQPTGKPSSAPAAKASKKAVPKPAPAPTETVAVAATPEPATSASITPSIMAGICFALFLFFEFMLWILHWRVRCEDGRNQPFTVKGAIQVDLKGRDGK